MLNITRQKFVFLIIFNVSLMGGIFYLDLLLPTGLNIVVSYIAVIMISLWLPRVDLTIYFALICSAFMVLGYLFSDVGVDPWMSLISRLLNLIALWTASIITIFRKSAALKLAQNEIRQKAVFLASIDPMITINQRGRIEAISHSVETTFGWSEEELIGKDLKILFAENENPELSRLTFSGTISKEQQAIGLDKSGVTFPCEISITEVKMPELSETIFAVVIRDIRTRKQAEDKLVWLSTHDELTLIYNRRYFNHQLAIEWKRLLREQAFLTVIMLDVDYFKKFNDTLGHQAGDECLKAIATAMVKSVHRTGDVVARYGGEEFVVLLPNTTEKGAIQIAKRIMTCIESLQISHPISAVSNIVTVSLGISSMIPTITCTPEMIVKQADYALYQAKSQGRNRYVFFEGSIDCPSP